jgi:glycosyltransferase involved in cell wall biosynthesis
MRIVFVDGRQVALQPSSGEDRPLPAIQSALLTLTRLLAGRGHEVHVFAWNSAPDEVAGVAFHDRSDLARFARSGAVDALVVVPEVLPLLMPIEARARMVWTGNAYSRGDSAISRRWIWDPEKGKRGRVARLYNLGLFASHVDRIVVGSHWQSRYVHEATGVPMRKLDVIPIGVPLEYYSGSPPSRSAHRIVYTSQPRRGLRVLLRLFPQIRAAVPDAELHVFGYDWASGSPEFRDMGVVRQPGVQLKGSLSKSQLAFELRSAAVMAYPCTFKETFCVAVAEAQAAGLPVVTTRSGALPERVDDGVDGFVVPGDPKGDDFGSQFVEAVVRLLMDGMLRERLGAAGAEKARSSFDWRLIATHWERVLESCTGGGAKVPPLEPNLDLLAPSLLQIRKRVQVPALQAARWLREEWASYGFDADRIPGLAREAGL